MSKKTSVKQSQKQRQAILWGRFSSVQQSDGDSRDRQERLNRECAKRQGISVISEHFDEGVSVKDGATETFKNVVKDLPAGVGIICENLDRINRGNPWRAKAYIADIIEAGHWIITSQDGREYNLQTMTELDTLVIGDITANVAYAENSKRIKRVRESKEQAIELARHGKPSPLGAWLPSHLRYNFQTEQYDINQDIADVTETIFKDYVNGLGTSAIAKKLNNSGTLTFGSKKAGCWTRSSVSELLRYEGTIGTLIIKSERIPKAFPPAISETLFYKVAGMLKQNKNRHGNYSGDTINNVFRGLCHCAKCGAAMKVYKKTSLGCTGYRDGKKDATGKACNVKTLMPFKTLEHDLFFGLHFVLDIDLQKPQANNGQYDLQSLDAKEHSLTERIDVTLELLDDPSMPVDKVKQRLIKLESERKEIANQKASVKITQSRNTPQTITELVDLMTKSISDQDVRCKVAAIVPSVIADIRITFVSRAKVYLDIQTAGGKTVTLTYYTSNRSKNHCIILGKQEAPTFTALGLPEPT